jgi:transcriptional regulator with XRE-family HTH domain
MPRYRLTVVSVKRISPPEHEEVSAFTPTETFLRNRLRVLRKEAGLTQEAVAELAGISFIFYQSIEAGRRPNASLKTIDKISHVYGLTIHELFAPTVPKVKVKRVPEPPHRRKRRRK